MTKPADILSDLRWTPDRVITNYEGDRVWLKACNTIPKGVTDCCLETDPCEYHARLTHAAPSATQ